MARPLRPYPYREGENNEGKVGTGIENLYVFDFYSVGALLSYFVRRSVIFFYICCRFMQLCSSILYILCYKITSIRFSSFYTLISLSDFNVLILPFAHYNKVFKYISLSF